jgi:ADP-heptose:LPS heptosyltransferase
MINKYIFFRTDRIGDFLLSAILIKCIKRSDKNSHITVVASKKNFDYIKKFDFIDETILFPVNYIQKILFYFKNFIKKYYFIGILDGKKRSIYFSILTKSKFKLLLTKKKNINFYYIFFLIKYF